MTTAPRAPRVVTVLAGLGLVALLLGLLAVVSPTVRDQLALSLTRQDQPFVETYFADVDQARACHPGRPRFVADVAVRSHLDEPATLPWVLRLEPLEGGRTLTVEGEVATEPGRESVVRLAGRKPARAYDVTVDFPGREQQLRVRCTPARAGGGS